MIYKVKSPLADFKVRTQDVVKARVFRCTDFYDSYIAWCGQKTRLHAIKENETLYKAVNKIFETIANLKVEKEGGVVAEGIGYFAYYMNPRTSVSKAVQYSNRRIKPSHETKYYNYIPYCFTDVFPDSHLKGWSMEMMFTPEIIRSFEENRKPKKLYYEEIKNIYSAD